MLSACSGGAVRPAGVSRASSKKTCESRKLSLIDSNICNASSGEQAARAAVWTCDWSRSNLLRAPSAAPISCSTQRRTSGGAALSCSKEKVKLVMATPRHRYLLDHIGVSKDTGRHQSRSINPTCTGTRTGFVNRRPSSLICINVQTARIDDDACWLRNWHNRGGCVGSKDRGYDFGGHGTIDHLS